MNVTSGTDHGHRLEVSKMFKTLKHFVKTTRGIASVEFALIAPIMILFMFGAIEGFITRGTALSRPPVF